MHVRALAAGIFLFIASGATSHAAAPGAPGKDGILSTRLCQEELHGGMQGQSILAMDLNGDGLRDLVIGAPYAREDESVGALAVYYALPDGFADRASTVIHGTGNLGWSMVALGEANGNGKSEFAAGAFSGSGENVSLSGTVTIFDTDSKPRPVRVLEGEAAMDKFGYALAAGDFNGDGVQDLLVGAPFHSPAPELYQKGAVYVYFGPTFEESKRVRLPATSNNGGIGFSVAAGDVNGDGIDDVLIQATGKVNIYFGAKHGFSPTTDNPDLVISGSDTGFGQSMAVLSGLAGEGSRHLAIGANQAIVDSKTDVGKVSTYTIANTGNSYTATLASTILGEPNNGRFGSGLLPVGDVDSDGLPDLLVSAIHADAAPFLLTGKLYLLSGKSLLLNGSATSAKAFPGDVRDMHFGTSLALAKSSGVIAAGAPTESASTGAVRLIDLR